MQQGLTATGQMHSEVISSINYQCLGPGTRHGGGMGWGGGGRRGLPILNRVAYALHSAQLTEPAPGKVKLKVSQSCLTLCDPMDYTIHGILQAIILEWVAFPFSRGSSQPRGWTQVSCTADGFFTSWATGKPVVEWWVTSPNWSTQGLRTRTCLEIDSL